METHFSNYSSSSHSETGLNQEQVCYATHVTSSALRKIAFGYKVNFKRLKLLKSLARAGSIRPVPLHGMTTVDSFIAQVAGQGGSTVGVAPQQCPHHWHVPGGGGGERANAGCRSSALNLLRTRFCAKCSTRRVRFSVASVVSAPSLRRVGINSSVLGVRGIKVNAFSEKRPLACV